MCTKSAVPSCYSWPTINFIKEFNHSANIKLCLYDFFYGAKPYSTLSWIPCYRLLNHWEGEINDINVGEALLKEGLFLNRNQKSARYASKTFKVEVVPLVSFSRDLNFQQTVNTELRISLLYLENCAYIPHILNSPNMVYIFLWYKCLVTEFAQSWVLINTVRL